MLHQSLSKHSKYFLQTDATVRIEVPIVLEDVEDAPGTKVTLFAPSFEASHQPGSSAVPPLGEIDTTINR